MLRQMTRRQRLQALLQDIDDSDQPEEHLLFQLATLLEPRQHDPTTAVFTELESAEFRQDATAELPDNHYDLILVYLAQRARPYRSFRSYPHPPHALVLHPQAKRIHQITLDKRHTFSRQQSHLGNSRIQFRDPNNNDLRQVGYIEDIYQTVLEDQMETFFLVRIYDELREQDLGKTPWHTFSGLGAHAVRRKRSKKVVAIQKEHIITHLVGYTRPAGTYGVREDFIVLTDALDRDRND